ncbi:DegT/DnrJ/EryC1/StrS family aminotransferase [Pelagibacteraceae bacterium]|jgi:dTDP-3-amino-2,3,6-trideoxy-4-keto-D-glucose/dTDP-3-amino-3,4,6-trideoxy-alpha-D-glucose/dTDP-2,6-dideoxy-D-kanosamine transaminase|nr:DegT/DnrJ/EryC1/StrS family aminotransferase [Pelagibacteraceae bacterium]
MKNFLPQEYKNNEKLKINHSYLVEQFADYSKVFKEIEKVVKKGDYTLGNEVDLCEKNFAKRTGAKYAISVGNGTDALLLSLKALDIGAGDEVITVPYTFVATVGSIVTAGAKPVFVDVKEDYNIDETKIIKAITKKTKAIMPVHWAGRPCEMDKIQSIAKKYKLKIIQDSAHIIGARFKKNHLVNYGDTCTYSMHPLKNLNVWGDGGFIVTNKRSLAEKLFLIRNHGLKNRNNVEIFGYNSRLDTIQAVVANYKMKNKLDNITNKRIKNSIMLDKLLSKNKNITLVKRHKHLKEVFHLYHINVKKRDELQQYLIKNKIDAKVHYPIPIHLQRAAKFLKYKKGDFPIAEKLASTSLSLPVHEFITKRHVDHVVKTIEKFYQNQKK